MQSHERQVPAQGPLKILDEERDWTQVADYLWYGGQRNLRKCFRIPITLLHFNIENGRYHTKFMLLKKAHQGVIIDPRQQQWKEEILKLLDGAWEDPHTGVTTRADKPHFEALVEDIRMREQERPGIVLEGGGVMSGNRRLAALITLNRQYPEDPKFQSFKAFIVPEEGGMSAADRWRLEISAQQGQSRLLREYESVERLLKIRGGVELLTAQNTGAERDRAIEAVARDFGTDAKQIRQELDTLKHIEGYLDAIGHPQEWWLAEGLTEVFTEWEPMEAAFETNALPFPTRAKVKAGLMELIKNDRVDYRFMRNVRTAIGPAQRRRGSRGAPSALKILTDNAPDHSRLTRDPNASTRIKATEVAEDFSSVLQAVREEESPLAKARRAEANLRSARDILKQAGTDRNLNVNVNQLVEALSSSRSLAEDAINLLGQEGLADR